MGDHWTRRWTLRDPTADWSTSMSRIKSEELLMPALLCNKEPARSKQKKVFCVPKPLVGGFGCDELVLYGIRDLALAIPRTWSSTSRWTSLIPNILNAFSFDLTIKLFSIWQRNKQGSRYARCHYWPGVTCILNIIMLSLQCVLVASWHCTQHPHLRNQKGQKRLGKIYYRFQPWILLNESKSLLEIYSHPKNALEL